MKFISLMTPLRVQKNYCYLLSPGIKCVYYRHYICSSCDLCVKFDFVNYTNEYCGLWKYHFFI